MSRIQAVDRIEKIALLALTALLLAGCKVGPNYARPAIDAPAAYRQALAPDIAASAPAHSIADEQWLAIFQDPVLQNLVKGGLTNNLDLRIAAQRVLQAQAQVGITRSQQMPSVSAGANYSALQTATSPITNSSVNTGPPNSPACWPVTTATVRGSASSCPC